jgi:hypothetical protein
MEEQPWYKNPYVWLVISLPLSAVIAGFITIWLAVITDDGLVSDDYYKEGMEINRVLERDLAAEKLGLSASINLDQETEKIKILLIAKDSFSFPKNLQINFLNRTRKGHDQQLVLERTIDGFYQGKLPDLVMGKWYLQIEADNWRLIEPLTTQ